MEGTNQGMWGMHNKSGVFMVKTLIEGDKKKQTLIDLKQEEKYLLKELTVQG